MRKTSLIVMFLLILLGTLTTLSGLTTWTVPGTYATIGDAVTALNAVGTVTDRYEINVAAGHTESITAPILLTATGTSGNMIVIQKSGTGANPVITRTDAGSVSTSTLGGQGDAVFIIQGTDYLEINGINLTAQNQGIEYGYYFRKASATNGDKYDTIKNCTVTMTKGTSQYVVGIYASNNDAASTASSATGITVTSTDGRNEVLSIIGNTIQNVHAGIVLRGYNHTSSPYSFYDQNNIVGQYGAGNIIQNYAGGSANTAYGVYLIYQTSPSVSYNTIANAAGGGTNASSTLYGIFFSTSSAGGTMEFNNNAITLAQGSTSGAHCIYVTPAGTSVSIRDNTIDYSAFASTTLSYGINCSNATNNMIIDGNYNSSPINKTGAGGFYPYYDNGSPTGGTATITNNNFSNITLTGSSTFYGIQHTTASTQQINVNNNTISSITGGTGNVYGLYVTSGAVTSTVHDNTVTDITNGGITYGVYAGNALVYNNTIHTLSTSGASSVAGIYIAGGTAASVYQHKIYDISTNNAGGTAYGIYVTSGTLNNIYNNMIFDIRAEGSSTAATIPAIGGIRISGGTTNNVHYNSILLAYDGANAFFATAGLYISSGTTNEIRNNIFVNKCTPGASGRSVAVWKTSTSTTNFGANSNKNIYFWSNGQMAYVSSTAYDRLTDWKSFLADRDQGSYEEDVPFVSDREADLHINPEVSTRVEGNAVPILALCDVDYDAEDRNDSTPDIGADEGEFTAVVASPGEPVYSSPADTATNVAINAPLVWSANSEGGTPTSYVVFFDQSDASTEYDTVTSPTINPPKEFGVTYYWKVKAVNNEGEAEGPVWSFSTATGVANLTYPGSGATGIPALFTFTWGAVAGAGSYKISCGTTPGGTDVLNMQPAATNSYLLTTPLSYLTPYYWSVYTVNGGQEIQSAEWTFTTMADPNFYPTLANPYLMDFEEITAAAALPQYWSKAGTKWTTAITTGTYNRGPRGGTDYATCAYSATTSDWLFSRPMYLDASKSYDFGMWYNTDGLAGWASFKMYIGTLANGTAMTTELASVLTPTNMTYAQLIRYAWQPPATGAYYIGFQVIANSTPWYMSFDDFTVNETASDPIFNITPTSWDFGTVFMNESASKQFTITNSGGGSLAIQTITVSGDHYSITANPAPVSLGMGISTNFTVQYAPTAEGNPHLGTVTITDGRAVTQVDLTGICVDPTIYAADLPYQENFDSVTAPALPLGWTKMVSSTSTYAVVQTYTSSTPHTTPNHIYMYNSGDASAQLAVVSPPIDPALSTLRLKFWAKGGTTGQTLYVGTMDEPGAKLTFTNYETIVLGTTYAEYTVDFDLYEGSNAYIAFMHGLGATYRSIYIDDVLIQAIPTQPIFSVTPSSKDFGIVGVGSQASQVFTVSNIGVGSLGITGVAITGAGAAQYSLTDTNQYTVYLGEGQSMNLTVNFAPTTETTSLATLQITDNLGKTIHSVSLTGQGTDAPNYGGGDASSTAGGYYFANNISITAPNQPNYSWVNQTANAVTETPTSGTLDDGYWTVPIGFEFLYYGNIYSSLNIGTNGFINFGTGATTYSNTSIPAVATPNNAIYLFWDDLEYYPGTSHIYYGGTATSFVISYVNMGRTGTVYNADASVTAQIVLYSDGKIALSYNDITGTSTTHTPTIGIENSDGTKGILYHYNGVGGPYSTGTKAGGITIMFGDDPQTLPVELSSFTATPTADMFVQIAWVSQSETNHLGYNILRGENNVIANAMQINPSIITEGNTVGTQVSYDYTDIEVYPGSTYYYWLESMDLGGVSTFYGPLMVLVSGDPTDPGTPPIPTVTELQDAYPNPFNPVTNLRYTLKEAGHVRIDIFNAKGQLIRSYDADHNAPGYYQLRWDGKDAQGRNVSSGIYLYRMTSGKYVASKKMVLAK